MHSWKAVAASCLTLLAGSIAILSLTTTMAAAIDIQPRDYRLLPPGTNLALAYYDYAHRGSLAIDGGPTYPAARNSTATSAFSATFTIPNWVACRWRCRHWCHSDA